MDPQSMLESDESFRAQFDKNSATHHGGLTTAVPLGGGRVPEGLKGQEDWTKLPEQPVEQKEEDYGPEYAATFKLRTDLEKLKKALANLNPPLDALLKLRTQKVAADASQHTKFDTAIGKETKKRDEAIANIRSLEPLFVGTDYDINNAAMEEILSGALKELNQEQLTDYMLGARRQSQKIFNEQKALLEKLKQLKKNKA
eukprot:TRINITY_DN15381_c0_g1_i1.p1 TRINITY_DN15381_c0_g1~~TRINITY_DN15381_c0_g1_i1.p1  ORF type:complete len:200 (+),score=59.99 TRINITY_DN15381_c0_g1_i1:94-693(+)